MTCKASRSSIAGRNTDASLGSSIVWSEYRQAAPHSAGDRPEAESSA
ncbi:MAG: hypothetical protein FWD31_08285 [Planctomycetaceae bacterium]|nr:hypothetical protein [Planctomycetaceae bacterium]